MSRTVTIASEVDGYVVLPDGERYLAGEEATLTDDEYAQLSTAFKTNFLDDADGEAVSDAPILVSPDETQYRLVVANDGTLSTEEVT